MAAVMKLRSLLNMSESTKVLLFDYGSATPLHEGLVKDVPSTLNGLDVKSFWASVTTHAAICIDLFTKPEKKYQPSHPSVRTILKTIPIGQPFEIMMMPKSIEAIESRQCPKVVYFDKEKRKFIGRTILNLRVLRQVVRPLVQTVDNCYCVFILICEEVK